MNENKKAIICALIGGAVVAAVDVAISAYAARKYERFLHDDKEHENDGLTPGADCDDVDNDPDAFEDIYQDAPDPKQPQVDLAALQQIRNDAYQNGYNVGYSTGYNAGSSTGQQHGYQAGYDAAATAVAEQVRDAYTEGKLDAYEALTTEEDSHDDANTDVDHPTVVIADTDGKIDKRTMTSANDPGEEMVSKLVQLFIEKTDSNHDQNIDRVIVATVLRAVLYAKGLPNEECSGRDALQAVLDFLTAVSGEEQFKSEIEASGNEKALEELRRFILLGEDTRPQALNAVITRLALYLQENPA